MCREHPENGSTKVTKVYKNDNKNNIGYGQQLQELSVSEECTTVRYTVNSQSDVDIEVKVNNEATPNILFHSKK